MRAGRHWTWRATMGSFLGRNGILLLVIISSNNIRRFCGFGAPAQSPKMQQPSDIVLYSLRLAKDSVSKVIITSSGMNAWTVHEYVSGKCGEMTIGMPDTASRRNRRGSLANRVSTIGPWSSSFRIEAAVGNFPSRWVIITLNGAEVVLRLEANRVNSIITPPVTMQSKNSSASSQGKHGRLGSKVEKRWDTSVSLSPLMVSVWRKGKNDGGSAMGGLLSTRTTL